MLTIKTFISAILICIASGGAWAQEPSPSTSPSPSPGGPSFSPMFPQPSPSNPVPSPRKPFGNINVCTEIDLLGQCTKVPAINAKCTTFVGEFEKLNDKASSIDFVGLPAASCSIFANDNCGGLTKVFSSQRLKENQIYNLDEESFDKVMSSFRCFLNPVV